VNFEVRELRLETMKPVNLIPVRRLIARQRQRHVRRCIVICSSWAFVIAGVCALGQGVVPGPVNGENGTAPLPLRLERAGKELEVAQQNAAAAREELANAQGTLRATRAIADQPDWSTLLALIGRATGDDVMLKTLELQPQGSKGSAATAAPVAPTTNAKAAAASSTAPKGGAFVLSASGLAQSQLAVTQFVLRLEKVGLFSKVTLLDTSREPFRDGEATSFRLECVIDPTPPAANAPTLAPGSAAKAQRGDKRS
jgi:hypothetical protein